MKADKVTFKRAKLSGWLDILAMLASLVMMAGYIVVEIVKVSGLPGWLSDFWTRLDNATVRVLSGTVGDWLETLPQYPGIPLAVFFGVFALLFLIMAVCAFRQGNSVLKRGGCAFAGVLTLILFAAFCLLFAERFITGADTEIKWYLAVPAAFLLVQLILKFSAYARAY